MQMNIYDFDGTIYDGDSSVDFFKFCLKKNKKILLEFPKILLALFLYLISLKEKEYLKSSFFGFLKYIDDVDLEVNLFWKKNDYKIKSFYLNQRKKDDIIISASPEFLLKPISEKYKFKLIASNVNKKTGEFIGKNCHGYEKNVRLNKIKIYKCKNFYSDSLSDLPLKNISLNAFIVKKDKIINWDDYKSSKIKKIFFDRHFFTFLFIGAINTFNGIWIAFLYSMFITNVIFAYILGFLISLCIAYILNSILNFKEKLTFMRFVKFVFSNIPNFCIQLLSVFIFYDILKYSKLLSYAISAVIAVPITFVLIKIFVFKKSQT